MIKKKKPRKARLSDEVRRIAPPGESIIMQTAPLEPLLSPKQLAAALGVNLSTIYRMVQDGKIPYVTLRPVIKRKLVRFRLSEVTAALSSEKTAG